MNIHTRIKLVIKHLVGIGIAPNQKGIGFVLGYKTESGFSQVVNGKVPMPDDFIKRLSSLDENLNQNWIISGNGEMVLASQQEMEATEDIKLLKERLELYEEKIEFYKEKIEKLENENIELKKAKESPVHHSGVAKPQ